VVAQLRAPVGEVSVTAMRRRHLRQVLAIEEQVYPRPWSPALFASELDAPGRCYLVALGEPEPEASPWPRSLRARQVLGYAGVMVQVGEAHITTVAVHPGHHRRKVASHLLVSLLEAAVDMGAAAATLEVRTANRGAQRLYAQFGFAPVGVRPGYYAETQEDAVIMWAYDLAEPAFAEVLIRQRDRLSAPGGASGAPDLHVPWVKGRVGLDGGGR
jgi:[ribosomal protein S18]-alanine N-acetyltransferase